MMKKMSEPINRGILSLRSCKWTLEMLFPNLSKSKYANGKKIVKTDWYIINQVLTSEFITGRNSTETLIKIKKPNIGMKIGWNKKEIILETTRMKSI